MAKELRMMRQIREITKIKVKIKILKGVFPHFLRDSSDNREIICKEKIFLNLVSNNMRVVIYLFIRVKANYSF